MLKANTVKNLKAFAFFLYSVVFFAVFDVLIYSFYIKKFFVAKMTTRFIVLIITALQCKLVKPKDLLF